MSTNENDVTNSPAIRAVEAVAQTIADPSIPVLVEDVMLAHKLAMEVNTQLAGKHPSIKQIFNTLFNW